ncbi:MAG TPA: hypothetical protein VG939_18630 [Caulobacteraceae bacterium]|nr:hypothetical protein [Caulobacteraceae bacterium]
MRLRHVLAAALGLVATSPTQAQVVGCRTLHGRMFMANGAPTVRIQVDGTRRVLGVVQAHERFDDLPAGIRRVWAAKGDEAMWSSELVGDFRVCALTKSRPGRMQSVSLTDGRRLTLRPRR